MMNNWRRQRGGDGHGQEIARARSQSRKPPLAASWQPTVPAWEKKFCTYVGSVPWRKIVETKKFIHLYDNILKWNDSAGKEAFYNAKNRFYAEEHNIPCDISLPDPDIYIDKVNWDSCTDPEMLLDLEREFLVSTGGESVLIFGNTLCESQGYSGTGWGDFDEDLKKATNSSMDKNKKPGEHEGQNNGGVNVNGWGDLTNNSWHWDENNEPVQANAWQNFGNYSLDWNEGRVVEDGGWGYGWNRSPDGNWGSWDSNNRRFEGTGGYTSRHKPSRLCGNDSRKNNVGKNGKVKNGGNFAWGQSIDRRSPSKQQWNLINSCGPVTQHASAKAEQTWSWEKPVS